MTGSDARAAATPEYSVVVPVYNESENIPELYRRLTEVLRTLGGAFELVFVDDGSTDRTFAMLEEMRRNDPAIRAIRFSRNFGHHIAITAGLDHARGEYIFLMDADLQDQPEDIPMLLAKCREGFDVVYGVRKERDDPWVKKIVSKLFIWFINRVAAAEVPMNSCVFRVMRKRVVEHLRRMRERERYVIGLMSWVGFQQTGVEVRHAARFAGAAKYNWRRSMRLGFNVLTSFSYFPLRLASYAGFAAAIGSLVFILVLIVKKHIYGIPVEGWTSLMVVVCLFGGLQLLCIGIIGEYLGRTYREVQARPLYVIDEVASDL